MIIYGGAETGPFDTGKSGAGDRRNKHNKQARGLLLSPADRQLSPPGFLLARSYGLFLYLFSFLVS